MTAFSAFSLPEKTRCDGQQRPYSQWGDAKMNSDISLGLSLIPQRCGLTRQNGDGTVRIPNQALPIRRARRTEFG